MAKKQTMEKILVTGAVGQIGSELTTALRAKYGAANVIAAGHRTQPGAELLASGPFEFINVSKRDSVADVVKRYDIDTIYHMAAILSAVGEGNPALCWDVNMNGLINVLDVAVELELTRVFVPSSIAVFGAGIPLDNTPNDTVLKPKTMYGVTKVAGEILAEYYVRRFGLDCRGVRYPGIISNETLPGGGTTDYAVAIYYEAVKKGSYECFVRADTALPMMYMPDAIKATLDVMEAPFETLKHHCDFNIAAMSFSAGELADNIRKYMPGFTCTFKPDFRQAIADSWPNSMDDTPAREEWGWSPAVGLDEMTQDMLAVLQRKHDQGLLE
jgi:nucleoside-diphosphate-sugar epimerase